MKEPQTAHTLQEEIANLSSQGRSGRLQIRAGDTRGAFFFRQGKLVDARVGPFTGLPAINLAFSIGEAQLNFDPAIEPPPSRFRDFSERILLRERFGIDTLEPEAGGDQPRIAEVGKRVFQTAPQPQRPETVFLNRQPSAAEKDEPETISEPAKSGRELFRSVEINQFLTKAGAEPLITHPQQSETTLAAVYPTPRAGANLFAFSTSKKFALRAGFIILVVIPAAVVAASYWKTAKQTPGLQGSRSLSPEPLLTPTPAHEPAAIPTLNTVRSEPQPHTRFTEAPLKIEDAKSVPVEVAEPKTRGITDVPAEDTARESNLSVKPSSRTVVVVVQIAEGHVTEAYIQNPQVGLGAYESTALRMARERRYPKETKGKQTVVLKVAERQKL